MEQLERRLERLTRQRDALLTRREARGDVRLARIANYYVEASSRGSRTQNADVAKQLAMTPSQVRDAVHRARLQGLLSFTAKQGVAGGELTPKALELLRAQPAPRRNDGVPASRK
jgi:CRP-like cAMP-binding protein